MFRQNQGQKKCTLHHVKAQGISSAERRIHNLQRESPFILDANHSGNHGRSTSPIDAKQTGKLGHGQTTHALPSFGIQNIVDKLPFLLLQRNNAILHRLLD